MTKVIYYINTQGENFVKKFIESLEIKQQKKVTRIIAYIEEYGLVTAIPHIKKLTGNSLWEIRILGQDNIRVFYAAVLSDTILLVHGFIKKSQQTPQKEITIALHRLKDWLEDQKTS